MKVLITGGMGYIGAHICTQLLTLGHRVGVVVRPTAQIWRVTGQVEILTGLRPWVFRADVCQEEALTNVMRTYKPDVVIHCAGQKKCNDTPGGHQSMFDINVGGMQSVLRVMTFTNVRYLVNLSTAASIGPIEQLGTYGQSKLIAEQVLYRHALDHDQFHALSLRVHNVAGAHPSGFLCEDEVGCSENLFTLLSKGMSHEITPVSLYPITRDYVHVSDVARAIPGAIEYVQRQKDLRFIDIGTGVGVQPIEVLREFERLNGMSIAHRLLSRPITMAERRVADPRDAQRAFGWTARSRIKDLCRDSWFTYTTGTNRTTPPPFSRIASCRSLS